MTVIFKKALVGSVNANGTPVHESFSPATDIFVGPDGKAISSNTQNSTTIENIFTDETERTAGTYAASDIGKVYVQNSDSSLWLLVNNDPQEWVMLGSTEQVYNYIYQNITEREGDTYTSADIGKIARQTDTNTLWILTEVDGSGNGTWVQILTSELIGQPNGIAQLDVNGKLLDVQMPDSVIATATDLTTHTGNTENPHAVTAAQVGAVSANTAITAGTNTKITYDSKGLVTGGATLDASDIPALDASKVASGIFDIARIPVAALERMVPVADQAARFALTTATVQLGDTVKQLDTGVMYVVIDESKLNQSEGYAEYTAATAAAVPWAGVTGKPTTLSGFGITDATPSSHIGATGSAHGTATTSVNGFMSNIDKLKLDGIQNGATANPGTVTNVSGSAPISVANGTTIPSITISAATTSAAGSMSAADKAKLDGIATGATANQGTVTNVTGSAPVAITNGTTTPNISMPAATASVNGYMTSAYASKLDGIANNATANQGTVTNVSGSAPISVSNGTTTPSITISAATTGAAGSMSAADKAKLDGIATGATANTAYDTTPAAATTTGSAGSSPAYARGDHAHPSRIATSAPASPQNGDIWIA